MTYDALSQLNDDLARQDYVMREKSAYLSKTARSTVPANILAPVLCIPLFYDEVRTGWLSIWSALMLVLVVLRITTTWRLQVDPEQIKDPVKNLRVVTRGVGFIGFGWGIGWIMLTPDLSMANRMIYLFITTGALISSMFGYSVHRPAFYAFSLPLMVFSLSTVLWPTHVFPWPFTLGLATLFVSTFLIAKNFSKVFEESIQLRFRNERLYRALAEERDQSVAANLAKSTFIASASHDLRQPMYAVNMYLESLRTEHMPDSERVIIQKIKNSVVTLNEMFESLLNVSKLDSLNFIPAQKPFSLQTLAQSLLDIAGPLARQKELALQIEAPENLWVKGDEKLLSQALLNLILNAIQYTEQGSIRAHLSLHDGLLMVEVSDTGCGIAPEDQNRIFDEFYRVDRTRSVHDGLGLGLSIVRRICKLIGASVEIKSSIGHGSTFTLRLPFAQAQSSHSTEADARVTDRVRSGDIRGKHIALIENDLTVREAYKHALMQLGAQVLLIEEDEVDYQNQMAVTDWDHIDFIISDYRLNQTDGVTMIHKLRETFNDDIPAMIVTADTSPSHIERLTQLNIPVLHKPISFAQVIDAIEQRLAECVESSTADSRG
jgi:signal transduction histidine kinase/ActR/RegA family two-component response regulator